MDILYATILVLVVTNQRIVLAADSRKTYLDDQGVQRIDTVDKIYQSEDFYYAISGFYEEEGKFSLYQIIHEQLSSSNDLHETIRLLAHKLAARLKDYFQQLKETSLSVFKQVMTTCAWGGEIIIVGDVKNVPTAFLIDYQIKNNATVKITLNTRWTDIDSINKPESCFWRAIGNVPVLRNALLAEREWALNTENNIKMLIKEGAKQYPNFVGGPINILALSGNGVYWMEKTPTAPNTVR